MVVFPVVAALVSATFSAALLRSFARRRGLPQLAWGVSLAMFAAASFALAYGMGAGWGGFSYRLFWLFGALLNVPWLAMGSIALLGRKPVTWIALALVGLASLFAIVRVFGANVNPVIEGTKEVPKGAVAWEPNPDVRTLASLYSIPAWVVVVAIAVWTSSEKRQPSRRRAVGNWLIAVGATIVAVGGFALARLAEGEASGAIFSVTLALGVAVMFGGFMAASRQRRDEEAFPGSDPGSDAGPDPSGGP